MATQAQLDLAAIERISDKALDLAIGVVTRNPQLQALTLAQKVELASRLAPALISFGGDAYLSRRATWERELNPPTPGGGGGGEG